MAILGTIGGSLGGIYGGVEGLVGVYHGTITPSQALWNMIRKAAYGGFIGAGVGAGLIGVISSPGITGFFLLLGFGGLGTTRVAGLDNVDGVLGKTIYSFRTEITRRKHQIKTVAASEGIPAELLASTLGAELMDYKYSDWLLDTELWTGKKHSMGIAQLRVDNVENWNLVLPEWGVNNARDVPRWKIRDAILDDDKAIVLLAKAIKVFLRNGYRAQGSVDVSSWNSFDDWQKVMLADAVAGAKDNIEGFLGEGNQLGNVGAAAMQVILSEELLK